MRVNKLISFFSIICLLLLNFAAVSPVSAAPNIDGTNKWAWSNNGGWINFNPSGGAVEVTDTAINGHIWIANYGWINLQPPGSGVTNTTGGDVGGQAWGENTGYIDFSGVSISGTGEFEGNATNAVLGTISFNCSNTSSCGSSDFKVQTSWLPTAGSGGSSGSFTQQKQDSTPAVLQTPTPVSAEVIDHQSIRFNWTSDESSNTGFKLYDAQGSLFAEVNDPAAQTFVVSSLSSNTIYDGIKITAFNSTQESAQSDAFAQAVTLLPPLQALMIERTLDTATFTIDPTPVLSPASTAIQFELLVDDVDTFNSGWITDLFWATQGVAFQSSLKIRVKSRNQVGAESAWSDYVEYAGFDEIPADLSVGFSLGTVSGAPVQDGILPTEILSGSATIINTSDVTAENVFFSLPLSQYVTIVPGSLFVAGDGQSDSADLDLGQQQSGSISAIWPQQAPEETVTVSFQLQFNREALVSPSVSGEVGAAVVLGPQITLQASVSASNLPVTRFSDSISFSPDIESLVSEPAPIPEPEPEPIPVPPTPAPLPIILFPELAPSPTEPVPESTDSGTEESLILTGTAQSAEELIEFTGTTSEPNSTIVVTFNDSVTRVLVSDENGVWRTFVNADELGIGAGESAVVSIEAVASLDNTVSNTVVQSVEITRAQEGEVFILDEQVDSQPTIENLVIETKEEVITSLSIAAPVVVLASPALWGYLPYLPNLLYHFLTWLIGLFRKKKEGRLYGVVYDSITKEPVPLSIIRVFQLNEGTRKLVSTVVSDKAGRYEVLLKPGEYNIEVKKPQYVFPSSIVTSQVDGDYQHVYNKSLVIDDQSMALPDLPIDPENAAKRFELANFLKKVWIVFQNAGTHLAIPVLLVGSLISVITLWYFKEDPIHWVLTVVYIIMLVLHLAFRDHGQKSWGIVYDIATGASLPLVNLQLIDPEFGKVVKSRLSDYEGRFAFLPEPGNYVIKANKPGYSQPEVVESTGDLNPIQGEVEIKKEGDTIAGDIAMKSE